MKWREKRRKKVFFPTSTTPITPRNGSLKLFGFSFIYPSALALAERWLQMTCEIGGLRALAQMTAWTHTTQHREKADLSAPDRINKVMLMVSFSMVVSDRWPLVRCSHSLSINEERSFWDSIICDNNRIHTHSTVWRDGVLFGRLEDQYVFIPAAHGLGVTFIAWSNVTQ